MNKTLLFLLSLVAASTALAQGEAKRHPASPEAPVPPVTYRSAFADYQPFRDQEAASWREINEEVARVGGHVGVLKAEKRSEGDAARTQRRGPDEKSHHHGAYR